MSGYSVPGPAGTGLASSKEAISVQLSPGAAEGTLTGTADRFFIDVSTDGRWNVSSNSGAVIDDLVLRRILRVVDDEDGDTIFSDSTLALAVPAML